MPALKGAMSYTRFKIEDKALIDTSDLAQKMNLFRFRPLHEKGEDSESVGWVPFLSEYDNEKPITNADILYDEKIVLCLRQDFLKMPRDLLKSMVKKSLSLYQKEHGKIASKTVKKEIELAEIRSLRGRVLPKTKMVEAVLCSKTGELRIFCRTSSLLDRFAELFQETFLLKLLRCDFAYYALQEGETQIANLESIRHQPIFLAPIRVDVV